MTGADGGFWARETRAVTAGLVREYTTVDPAGPRGRQATATTVSVLAAVVLAQWLHLEQPAWAAISAFISAQATAPATLRRGLARIGGTIAGAAVAVMLAPWLLYDMVACILVLMAAGFAGILGMIASRHGYAWLLGCMTLFMVVLSAVGNPALVLTTAFYRVFEVAIGTAFAMGSCWALMPPSGAPPAAPPPPSPAIVRHALRAGVAIGLTPLVWMLLDLPGLSQMAVTIAAVMAVPALTGQPAEDRVTLSRRALHRVGGCLVGGGVALAMLGLSVQDYAPWLALLGGGVWLGTVIHAMPGGISYVGTQGTVAFILTLVQGSGPPGSVTPGLQRLAAILVGLLILTVVTVLLTPEEDGASPPQGVTPRSAPDRPGRG